MSALVQGLPKTWGSPTMAPFCPDDRKYQVVDAVTQDYQRMQAKGERILGQKIARLVTVNGVRVTLEDGTWGLVRASSNKPWPAAPIYWESGVTPLGRLRAPCWRPGGSNNCRGRARQ